MLLFYCYLKGGNELNGRIKALRKALNLTQQEFGDRIGIKRNSVALIENGRNTSDQTIFSICREFNVSEEWLRTGKGEMFNPAPNSELDALAKKYDLSNSAYVLIEKFVGMKKEQQEKAAEKSSASNVQNDIGIEDTDKRKLS